MNEGTFDFVGREYEYISARPSGADFVLELVPFLEALRMHPGVAGHLDAMAHVADAAIADYQRTDETHVSAMSAFAEGIPAEAFGPSNERRYLVDRERLAALANEMRETSKPTPFPRVVARHGYEDPSRSAKFLDRLRHIVQMPDEVRDSNELHGQAVATLIDLRERHEHNWRAHAIRIATSPGIALNRLDLVIRQLNPRPEIEADDETWLSEGFSKVVGCAPKALRRVVDGAVPPVGAVYDQMERVAELLKLDVERVYADLRRRITARRSRASAIRDYKLRCSWFDAEGIAKLIDEIRGQRMKEDRLSDHFALFLFDQGHRPAVRSNIGRLIPDFFESGAPSTSEDAPFEPSFYIEAKQYADSGSDARTAVNAGVRQIWSTAGRIRARFDLSEAHLVVFRRSGPLLVFDGEATKDGLTVTGHVIDVAPGNVSGSKQSEVVHVPATALLGSEPW